jgi:hypothetical protein
MNKEDNLEEIERQKKMLMLSQEKSRLPITPHIACIFLYAEHSPLDN